MSQRTWLLWETTAGYRVADAGGALAPVSIDFDPQATAEERAKAIAQSLSENGYLGEPVLLAIASQSCLAATFPHTGRSMARNHQAMAFALEESLPIAAEDVTCDFVSLESDALGVALEIAAVQPFLSALEGGGVNIASITPAAVLVLQEQLKQHAAKQSKQERHIVLLQCDTRLELFEVLGGKPRLWRTLPQEPEVLTRELKTLQLGAEPSSTMSVTVFACPQPVIETVRNAIGDKVVVVEQSSPEASLLKSAAAALSGSDAPWIELRRGPLGHYDPYRPVRPHLKLLAVAIACLLVALSAAAWIRGDRYTAIADSAQQAQEDIFRKVFPGKAVPVGVQTRLASEYQKLSATKGESQEGPRLESVTPLLHDVLVSLPKDIRYRLLELCLEPGQVRMEGEVCRHGDADLVADGLRKQSLSVVAPHTQQRADQGVSVSIAAARGDGNIKKR